MPTKSTKKPIPRVRPLKALVNDDNFCSMIDEFERDELKSLRKSASRLFKCKRVAKSVFLYTVIIVQAVVMIHFSIKFW